MDFNWSEPTIIDEHKFSADNLERAKYATYLTSLIKTKGGTDKNSLSNYVLNLDAEWGAGKTYFLKRWSEDLKASHPVVYIDAWAIDYLESPLMTVLSEIIEQLRLQTDKIDSTETQKKLTEVVKAAAPRIGSALMKRYLGFDFNIFDSAEPVDSKPDGSIKEIDFSKAGEKVLEVFCKEVTDSKKSVKTLKLAIQNWVEYVVEHPVKEMDTITKSFPAFIFIDELDRCKPTYAVEMLEAIKHVFDIPGLVFVVATNTHQLSHTVKAVYGNGFNAEGYLSRFFDNRYYLKTELNRELIKNYGSTELMNSEKLIDMQIVLFPFIRFDLKKFLSFCISVFTAVDLTPRQAVKVYERIYLTVVNLKKGSCVNVAVVVFLFALQEKSSKMFAECYKYTVTARDIHAIHNLFPKVRDLLVNLNVDVDIDLPLVRNNYEYVSNHVGKFESHSFFMKNMPNTVSQTLFELLGFSNKSVAYSLGFREQLNKVNELVFNRDRASLADEVLSYYILLLELKVDPSYYMDLTNMAVSLD
tara:strand:- start:1430 stop:3013 length:1584 start_codon:yes stop_codon:yes gene_type:complete